MPRESRAAKTQRARIVVERLRAAYPNSRCSLEFRNPFQLLVAVMLSAQCTDARVNQVTPALFAAYPDAPALARASPATLERLVFSTGFYREKARHLRGMAQQLVAQHGGHVPRTMEELIQLPGVARKTANVVLHNAFQVASGIAVDTHVHRIARRLRLTGPGDPKKAETQLMAIVARSHWGDFTHWIIDHGRAVCTARKPDCGACVLADVCPSRRPDASNSRAG